MPVQKHEVISGQFSAGATRRACALSNDGLEGAPHDSSCRHCTVIAVAVLDTPSIAVAQWSTLRHLRNGTTSRILAYIPVHQSPPGGSSWVVGIVEDQPQGQVRAHPTPQRRRRSKGAAVGLWRVLYRTVLSPPLRL